MYCGIDVSKGKSSVCILDENKKVIVEFEIQHDKQGFEQLESHLTPETKIGMETTSNYCKALYTHLRSAYNVCYVDNMQMKNFAKLHFAHIKNDQVDAKLIATYLSYGFKEITVDKNSELKDLVRLYHKMRKYLTLYKLSFKSQLCVIFPELEKNFYLKSTKAVCYLLLKYPTPHAIANATVEEVYTALTENLVKSSYFTMEYATRLHEAARQSVGVKKYPIACFRHTIKLMLFYESLISDILGEMKTVLLQTPYASLLKVFGYNEKSLSIIVGEIGDIRRFANHKKFVSYCGLDVSEKQSGMSKSVNCYITKRGNKYLRHLFYNLVLPHLAYKTEASPFFYRLKEGGKHPKKCMIAMARKLAVKAYFDLKGCHT